MTSTTVRPSRLKRLKTSKQRSWKRASPTASTSSISRIPASAWMATANASRTCIPDEKFLSFWSANSSSSAKAMISSRRTCRSRRVSPSTAPLRKTFSLAVSSGLNPTPSSRNGDTRLLTLSRPAVG